jgi:protein-S-isoprenylcysteine O-methyltransferase Ste14
MSNKKRTIKSRLQRLRVPLGFLTAIIFLIFSRPSMRSLLVGLPIALCGVAIRAWASGHLRKNAQLAITGPYAHTRNPLYFGSFVLVIGCAIAGYNWGAGTLLLVFFLLVYWPVMQAEAEHMITLFADAYREWAQNVPLFFPRLTPWQPHAPDSQSKARSVMAFDRSLYLRYREYRALIGVLIVFGILAIKSVL